MEGVALLALLEDGGLPAAAVVVAYSYIGLRMGAGERGDEALELTLDLGKGNG